MSIHEHLPPQARRELKEVGWTKGLELATNYFFLLFCLATKRCMNLGPSFL